MKTFEGEYEYRDAASAALAPAAGYDEEERRLQPVRAEKPDPAADDEADGDAVLLRLEGEAV